MVRIYKFLCCCLLLQWLLLLTFLSEPISAKHLPYPRLGVLKRGLKDPQFLASQSDFDTFNYTQTLDHFNYKPESFSTFQQRYVINSRYWGGPNTSSPILVYTGDEGGLEDDVAAAGFMTDNAHRFKALLVYIEHRYYGTSVPFGSREEAYRNASTLGYFSSEQALADYAELITYLKKKISADNCPVIVIGGSYGGMLAAWFRLKYPHIAMGALASSAPILYFDDLTPPNGYHFVVTEDFKEASESCYSTVRESWFEIDRIASQSDGLAALTQKFKSCNPLNRSTELKDYLESLYCVSAQYDAPPDYPVNELCKAIDGAPQGSGVLDRILAGVVAVNRERNCYDMGDRGFDTTVTNGWDWQTCSELAIPMGRGSNDTMFQASPFDLNEYMESCHKEYGVYPRPHWVTTEFGGHNIRRVLEKFATNIIFSNGLRDPYSSGGVLQNISDSIVAVYTTEGSHCLDILASSSKDPDWLTKQRDTEVKMIEGWIAEYKADLVTGKEKTKPPLQI
ncbi:hypothetical protein H6P81_001330 [Aristolochia fimbriata]|uniref:Lysosomal Pro-X carboxypeptidase n=1 Tax=Aristolochia fimbriata TaxID=158543 RepID=A0AAV7F9V3_ARIFI|nr:hypothetical protein H6P81_001330 [Aristolochia fimbriata]